jgi:hypothetical protein
MKILFDQGTPLPLRRHLPDHTIRTAYECGWSAMENGALLRSAEEEGFELLVTTDRNLKYQQNLKGRRISILVLMSTSWPKISAKVSDIQTTVESIKPGDYVEQPI